MKPAKSLMPKRSRVSTNLPPLEWRVWLPESAKPSLQEVFYFNPRQAIYREEIVACVEQFGDPVIFHGPEGITLVLPKLPEAQCLFACNAASGALCGVILYVRHDLKEMEILHLATSREWQSCRDISATTARLVAKIVGISRAIRGIEKVLMPYGRGSLQICSYPH